MRRAGDQEVLLHTISSPSQWGSWGYEQDNQTYHKEKARCVQRDMGWWATIGALGNLNHYRTHTGETPFSMAYGTKAMSLVEVGLPSTLQWNNKWWALEVQPWFHWRKKERILDEVGYVSKKDDELLQCKGKKDVQAWFLLRSQAW